MYRHTLSRLYALPIVARGGERDGTRHRRRLEPRGRSGGCVPQFDAGGEWIASLLRSYRAKSRCPSAWCKVAGCLDFARHRSEEHTSELQSLMRISYAVF